jgi:hypothetical protein
MIEQYKPIWALMQYLFKKNKELAFERKMNLIYTAASHR